VSDQGQDGTSAVYTTSTLEEGDLAGDLATQPPVNSNPGLRTL